MKVRIYRYIPEVDLVPRMQDHQLDLRSGEDLMVLDGPLMAIDSTGRQADM